MDSAANSEAADLSREITGDKNLSHIEGIIGAALDFAVGGGTVSQSLKRYGIETRAALGEVDKHPREKLETTFLCRPFGAS